MTMSYQSYHRAMKDLYDQAPDRVRMRAKGYFSGGNLLNIRLEEGILSATVRGTQEEPYEVVIDLDKRKRKCSCPAHYNYRNIPCKHQVLAVLPLIGTKAGRS